MYPLDFPHVLHRGEIHQTRINKFSHKPRRPEAEKICVWHHAKEKKDGKDGKDIKTFNNKSSKIHKQENARKETFEVEDQERRAL